MEKRGIGKPLAHRLTILLFSLFSAHFLSSGSIGILQDIDQSRLPKILDELASYCRKFGNASLNYVCLEDVEEIVYSPYRQRPRAFSGSFYTRKINQYVYDYQLLKKGEDIREQRILIEENGKKKHVENADLQAVRFQYWHVILGPMLLSEYWQPYHDYRIVGREKVEKEPCLVIEAIPKPYIKPGHLFGRIWVSERDLRVWRIEWYQESIRNYEEVEETAKELKAKPQIKMTMDYAIEEKGIRFPSQYVISEGYVNSRGQLLIRSETKVAYKKYKFFTVETEVEFKKGG
jgi:hypothetical protein